MKSRWNSYLVACIIGACIVLGVVIWFFQEEPPNEPIQYDIHFFKKRYWCPSTKKFGYEQALIDVKEENLTNYYTVSYFQATNKVAVESAHKDFDTPAGNWFYYNQKGQLIKELVYKKANIAKKIVYRYGANGQLKERFHFIVKNSKKKLRSKSVYHYSLDQKNQPRLIKTENYNQGILDEYIQYDYDLQGRMTKETVFILAGQLKNYFLYHYNDKNQIQREEAYDRNDEQQMKSDFRYNASDKLVEKRLYKKTNDGQWYQLRQTKHRYSSDGWKIEQSVLESEGPKTVLKLIYRRRFGYNSQGCRIWEKRFDRQSRLVEQIVF